MPSKPIICIDPGHGGRFKGASGSRSVEKDAALRLALTFRNELATDFNLVLTRENDVDLAGPIESDRSALRADLAARCRICNDAGADLFISLHYNSFHIPAANGFEVLYWHTSTGGARAAKLVVEHFEPVGRRYGVKNRGAKARKNIYVLRHTRPPAIIIEAGFISNPDEEPVVTGDGYQSALAGAARNALHVFFGE